MSYHLESRKSPWTTWNSSWKICSLLFFVLNIYLCQYGHRYFTLDYSPVLFYFIAQIIVSLPAGTSFSWYLYPFDIFPLLTLYVYVLFEHLLTLAVWESPDLPCLCPASVLGSAISLRSPESSHWRKGIVTKILGVLFISQVVLLLGSLSWQEGVYVCVLILCMYIYEYFCM